MSKSYSPAQYAPVETRNLKQSPNCVFYVNGDRFATGSRVCISNRIRTFDGVKDELTKTLFKDSKTPGHVRYIFTPDHGSRICSKDDLRDGQHYVASLNDRFKPLPYQGITPLPKIGWRGGRPKKDYFRRYTPVQHALEERLRNKSGRCKYLNEQVKGLRLRVHQNGANERPACPVSILFKDKENMEKIKEGIEKSLHMQPIERMFKIINMGGHIENFQEVVDPSELDSDEHILVMTRAKKDLDPLIYNISGKQNLRVPTSPHAGNWYLYPAFPAVNGRGQQYRHNNSLNKHKPLPSIGSSSKQSDPMSPYSNPPSTQRSRKNKPKHVNPDFDADPGQVYRAKNQGHARGARQVNESKETRTERPIDDMEAEVVEEDLHTQDNSNTHAHMNDSTEREPVQNDSLSKTNEVNMGRSMERAKVGVLPPEVDDERKSGDDLNNVTDSMPDIHRRNDEKIEVNEIREGQVQENINHFEGMNEREVTPDDLKSTDLEMNKAPLATASPKDKPSSGSSPVKERIDEDAVPMDDSFSRYDRNSGAPKKDPRSSTPASSGGARRQEEAQRQDQAATKLQAGAKGYLQRKKYKAEKAAREQEAREREEARRIAEQNAREADRQKKEMSEHDAATKIQAGFRGYEARRNLKQKKVREHSNKLERENQAATKLQSGFRGHMARKEYRSKKKEQEKPNQEHLETVKDVNDNEKDIEKQHNAATKIQSSFRGHAARKQLKSKKASNDVKQEEKQKEMSEDEAANKINAGFKGYQQRKRYAELKKEKEAEKAKDKAKEEAAATRIQAGVRGHMARKSYKQKQGAKRENDEALHKQNEAATKIQAGFKGYATRKKRKDHKNETQLPDSSPRKTPEKDLEAAATTIQKNYRGYAARKDLKAKQVINACEGESDVDQLPDSTVSRPSLRKGQFIPGSKDDVASKLQMAFRAYRCRKVFIDHETMMVKLAERKIIAAYKGFLVRKQQQNMQMTESRNITPISAEPKIYPTHAVEVLSASFRGYIARRVSQKRIRSYNRVISVEGGWYYATVIQALCRGYMTRHQIEVKPSKPKPRSADSIQGPTKSDTNIEIRKQTDTQKSYWEDSNVKMYSDKTLRQASAKIQSAYHMYQTRQKHRAWKAKQRQYLHTDDDKIEAAIKIQSFYRHHHQRKLTETEKESKMLHEEEIKETFDSEVSTFMNESTQSMNEISVVDANDSPTVEVTVQTTSRPTSSRSSKMPIDFGSDNSRPGSRKRKRQHSTRKNSGKSRHGSSSDVTARPKSVDKNDILDVSVISMESSRDSIDTRNIKSAIRMVEKVKRRSANEVEEEGISPREIEDDEGELSSIEKNVSNVSQLQAAFRAYKMRREVSELLGGGEELIDIKKVKSAVSALKKDFRLRSAKVRRLGSYQFSPGRDNHSGKAAEWWETEGKDVAMEDEGMNMTMTGGDLNITSSTEKSEDTDANVKTGSPNDCLEVETVGKTFHFKNEVAAIIQLAARGYNARREFKKCSYRKKTANAKIKAAYCGYRTRVTEQKRLVLEEENARLIENTKKAQANSRIEAAFCGYRTRQTEIKSKRMRELLKNTEMKKRKHKADSVIRAAYHGYKTRNTQSQLRNKGRQSNQSFHVEMHSDVINERATQLQAAFASYQTRSIFISLTKLVEQDHDSSMNVSSGKLERMGSLSETDDFKLRHKSIAKLQAAFEEHKSSVENKTVPEESSASEDGTTSISKPSPNQFEKMPHAESIGLSRIQIYISKMAAATTIQSHVKAYILRQEFANKLRNTSKCSKSPEKAQSRRNSRDSSKSNWAKEEMTEMVKVRTTSVKLEAEKRKVIAEQNRLSQEVSEARENVTTVKLQAEKVKAEKRKASISGDSNSNSMISDRKEHDSAVKIQKVYRGHRVRRELNSAKNIKRYENEYEEWKHKRIEAAVAIQSGWRGYIVRKELKEKEISSEESGSFDHLQSGMLVINIGRSKSEIARAEKRYENASLIQMVWKASSTRRQMKVKMAVHRHEKSYAACKIQAWYRGYLVRQKHRKSKCATQIQSIFKAYLARVRMSKEKLRRQQLAATCLQSAYRSFSKRRQVETEKEERRKIAEMHESAKAIQSGLRGFLARKELGDSKEKLQQAAAAKIQACMKGYGDRQKARERKCALLIWSAFKGYKERSKLKAKLKASALLIAASRALKQRQELKAKKRAASVITSAYKSFNSRKIVRGKKEGAKVISSAYRSYKQRLQMKLFKEKKETERIAATKIQSAYKGNRMRHETRLYRERMILENRCASHIQSSLRGRKARIDFKKLRITRERNRKAAALKIQSLYRGHRGRTVARQKRHARDVHEDAKYVVDLILKRSFDYLERRSDSADRIIASYKGFCSRKKMMDRLSDEAKIRAKERYASATCIQAVVRAKQTRDKLAAEKELEIQNRAAVKIQSLFRGHSERKHIARERAIIASIKPPIVSARTRSGRLLELKFDDVLMNNARAIILFHKKATELQDAFRAYKMRREVLNRFNMKMKISGLTPRQPSHELITMEDKAAVMIQKTFRGYNEKKNYQTTIVHKREVWSKCASQIQASLRGYLMREEARKIREVKAREGSAEQRRKRHAAVNVISCAFRALKSKQTSIASRAEM